MASHLEPPPSKTIMEMVERGDFADAYAYSLPFAEQGDLDAQLYVGWMLHTGHGVKRDLREAEKWYRLAVGAGSARAKFNLGALYWSKRDYASALEWFEKAGADGFSPALYHLGRMYRRGAGVVANPAKAHDYIEQAAKLGHVFAAKDVAFEMLKGRRGLTKIPLGLVRLVSTVRRGFTKAYRDIRDDALLRL